MIFKLPEITPGENNVFQNDKLGREKEANLLSSIVDLCDGGAVLALDGAWGTGKTIFLKLWRQHIGNGIHSHLF